MHRTCPAMRTDPDPRRSAPVPADGRRRCCHPDRRAIPRRSPLRVRDRRSAIRCDPAPPTTRPPDHDGTCRPPAPATADVVARREPEEALARSTCGHSSMQQIPQTLRVKRPARPINQMRDAGRFCGFVRSAVRRGASSASRPRSPSRRNRSAPMFRLRPPARRQNALDEAPRAGSDHAGWPEPRECLGRHEVRLVHDDHIAKFDLLDQRFHDRAIVVFVVGSCRAR